MSFGFPERTRECGHFAPKINRIGSRSSENETIEVSKYRHAWIWPRSFKDVPVENRNLNFEYQILKLQKLEVFETKITSWCTLCGFQLLGEVSQRKNSELDTKRQPTHSFLTRKPHSSLFFPQRTKSRKPTVF